MNWQNAQGGKNIELKRKAKNENVYGESWDAAGGGVLLCVGRALDHLQRAHDRFRHL